MRRIGDNEVPPSTKILYTAMRSCFFLAGLCILSGQVFAQAPQTVSHQGYLTNLAGVAVKDSTWSITFALYDVSGGGGSIWSSTEAVTTSGGVYNVVLGPISGVDFSQPIDLGVKIEPAQPEIVPRTSLTSVPSAFALVHPYKVTADTSATALWIANEGSGAGIVAENSGTGNAARVVVTGGANASPALYVENAGPGLGIHSTDTVKIEVGNLDLKPGARQFDGLIIEGNNAVAGLYSDIGGGYGSSVILGEVDGSGDLTDKWAMARMTSTFASNLNFTFGQDRNYGLNPAMVAFDTLGNVKGTSYRYTNPRTGYLSLSAQAFMPQRVDASTSWNNDNLGAYFLSHSTDGGAARAPLQLPHGATLTSFACEIDDVDGTHDLVCGLFQDQPGYAFMASVTSSGSLGLDTYQTSTISGNPIDNSAYAYTVIVFESGGDWGTPGANLKLRRVFIEYTLAEIP